MGGNLQMVAGDGAPFADAECGELEYRHQCMWGEHAVGGSPSIAAGDGVVVAGTGRRELRCSHQRPPEE